MSNPITILGYSDRLSGQCGEQIAFKVSSRATAMFDATLVRVIHADANPAGPGMKFEPLPDIFSSKYPSRFQSLQGGSYARIQDIPSLSGARGFTFGVRFFPTALHLGPQCLLSQRDAVEGSGISVIVDAHKVQVHFYAGEERHEQVTCPVSFQKRWYDLTISYSPTDGKLQIIAAEVDRHTPSPLEITFEQTVPAPWQIDTTSDLILAAEVLHGRRQHCFNGKLERPFLLARALTKADVLPVHPVDHPALLALWDFSKGIDTQIISDIGPGGRHGHLANLPARAVTGSLWDNSEMCWRHAAAHYAAIHFHDDDLHDAQWETDFTFEIPAGLRSGSYAMRLSVDGHTDYLPFYVRPVTGTSSAKVLFIASTYTYQAYANFARGNYTDALKAKVAAWGAYPHNPDEHLEYGLSTYNRHSDGSGVYFSSRLRPMLTFRPGFMTFDDARGSGCRHYIADSHLLDWLEHEGIDFDVATDEDIQADGAALMAPYACVLTGTHPEYHTTETLDAFAGYLRGGGNLAYLGGNGFYWRIGRNDALPGVLEMRRNETGTRAWATPAGEYFHALDGQYGGLWRSSGRPPNQLVGIGFASQGPYEASHFRVLDEARSQTGGWILDGVDSGKLGDFGLCAGGAAGFELDATEPKDGTPDNVTVLARSEGHGPGFGPSLDSLLSHTMTLARGKAESLIRAEMIHYDTGFGGQVFSVGSITFCGALSHNQYRNDVSTLLRNVVLGFSGTRSNPSS
jgi:N,N-dimethylformamidase